MPNMELDRMIGSTAVDSEGAKVGTVGQVYLSDETGQQEWVTVSTGLFGKRQSFAPRHSTMTGDDLRLAVSKDLVRDAPHVDDDGHLDDNGQRTLYDHYAQYLGGTTPGAETDRGAGAAGGDDAMTRSEEQVRVGTEKVQAGRARLRKYVVTENVSQTVPVSHEEVRVEREPITDAGAATDGPAISESEHEVTLHAERPVVQKEAVPVERVRMDTETVTEQATVDETVRKEQIEVEGDEGKSGKGGKTGRLR